MEKKLKQAIVAGIVLVLMAGPTMASDGDGDSDAADADPYERRGAHDYDDNETSDSNVSTPLDAGRGFIYLGHNVDIDHDFGYCNGKGQKTFGQEWYWKCNSYWGRLGGLSNVRAPQFTSGSASTDTWSDFNFNVRKHCTSQTPQALTGTVTAYYSYAGTIYRTYSNDVAKVTISVGVDGVMKEDYSKTATRYAYGHSVQGAKYSDPISIAAKIGDNKKATINLATEASSTRPIGLGISFADFYNSGDWNQGVNLFRWVFKWDDPSKPTASHSVTSAASAGGWHKSPATIKITANDPETCVETIDTYLDGTHRQHSPGYNEYPQQLSVSGTGLHSLTYKASNYAAGSSGSKYSQIGVDGTPPTTSHSVSCSKDSNGDCESRATVRLNCSDRHSGCDQTRYRLNGGAWNTGNTVAITSRGDHTVEYYSTDAVTNKETSKTAKVKVVCGGIELPLGLCVGL